MWTLLRPMLLITAIGRTLNRPHNFCIQCTCSTHLQQQASKGPVQHQLNTSRDRMQQKENVNGQKRTFLRMNVAHFVGYVICGDGTDQQTQWSSQPRGHKGTIARQIYLHQSS